jgi:hypothetical protein
VSSPPQPEPDTKDWTWVLERPCPECGFDASTIGGTEVAEQLRAATGALRSAVLAPGSDMRPRPDVWSALEYGAHVRDAYIVYGTRFMSMRHTHDPLFPDWNQDETALAERYWEQDPRKVADELSVEGDRLARDLDDVRPDEWQRCGRRSNGSVFTIDTLARYLLHDVVHHLHDVNQG